MNLPCSPALAVESSGGGCWDGVPSARLKSTTIAGGFSCSARMMESLNRSPYGQTLEHSTGDHGLDAWILSLADSRVPIYQPQDEARGSMGKTRGYGPKWRASSVKYDLDTSSWKIARSLFPEDLLESLVTLPKWGCMRDGELLERTTPAHLTSGTGSGLWQTPTVQDANGRDRHNQLDGSTRPSLLGQVRIWPTPTATQYKGWSKGHNRADSNDRLDYTIERQAHQAQVPGKLNPDWVEYLMGWPISWTSVEPLKSDKILGWETDPADDGSIPRTTQHCLNRVSRLKAIGNGQVPAVVMMAWRILNAPAPAQSHESSC